MGLSGTYFQVGGRGSISLTTSFGVDRFITMSSVLVTQHRNALSIVYGRHRRLSGRIYRAKVRGTTPN